MNINLKCKVGCYRNLTTQELSTLKKSLINSKKSWNRF